MFVNTGVKLSEDRPTVPFGAWWMVFVLFLFNVLSMLDRQILVMLVPPIQQELGISDFSMSLLMGPAIAISGAVAAVPMGWAADRFSRRWVIFLGVLVWSVATLGTGLAASFAILFLFRSIIAIGEASLSPSAYSLIAERFPRERLMSGLSVYGLAPKIGIAIAFALGGLAAAGAGWASQQDFPLIGGMSSWRLTLVMIAIPGVLLALLAFSFQEPRSAAMAAKEAVSWGDLIAFCRQHAVMIGLLVGGFSLMGVASGAINNWTPTYMTRQFGWTAQQYGPPLAIISLIGAAAIIPKGLMVDWLYRRGHRDAHVKFFVGLQILGLPLILLSFLTDNIYTFFVLFGLVNIVILSFTLYLSAALQIIAPPRMRGRITASCVMVVILATLLMGPTSVGALTDFVFRDPGMIGRSLCIVAVTMIVPSGVLLALACQKLSKLVSND